MNEQCEINIKGEKVIGTFIGIFQQSRIVDPSPMLGGHSGGVVHHPIALVRVDNKIKEADPENVEFTNEEKTFTDMTSGEHPIDGIIENLNKFQEKEVDNVITANLHDPKESDIIFRIEDKEILKLSGDGNIYVNGRNTENDSEVVEALRMFLRFQGYDL